jgi:hypothetical protein
MRFRGTCMERVRVVRFFDEAAGADSPDHTSHSSGAPGSRVLFDAGRSYRRRPSSSLSYAASRGTPPDRLE